MLGITICCKYSKKNDNIAPRINRIATTFGLFVKFAKNSHFFHLSVPYIYKKCVILHNRAKTATINKKQYINFYIKTRK